MATVPARVLGFLQHACERNDIDIHALAAGIVELDPWPRGGRVRWAAVTELLVRLEHALGGPEALEQAGYESNASNMLEGLKQVIGAVASSRLLYRAIVTWFGPRFVEFMHATYDELPSGYLRIVMVIPDDIEPSPEFFRYTLGAYRGTPRLIGRPDSLVTAEIEPRRAVFLVLPPPDLTLVGRLRRGLRTIGSPRLALQELAQQQAELQSAYQTLLGSRRDVERIVDRLPIGIAVLRGGAVSFANSALAASLDTSPSALVGARLEHFAAAPTDREALAAWLTPPGSATGEVREFTMKSAAGRVSLLELSAPTPITHGGESSVLVATRETTAARAMEEELRQAKKLEAIGSLAAGIAHDFNNMLSAILGFATILAEDLPVDSPFRGEAEQIIDAASRASSLTKQLLAFARKQMLSPRVMSVNDMVAGMHPLLRRVLREDVRLDIVLAPALDNVVADPSQLEQVVLNLVINARDAIAGGGRIVIETKNVILGAEAAGRHAEVHGGPYVMLAISDNGAGMTAEVLDRAFEPFFTTKPKGAGTGLGLSTVFGIVKQSGGHIWAYSEPGSGTTFKVFLPRFEGPVEPKPVEHALPSRATGDETVLLVEDDPGVRAFAKTALERGGYRVLVASDPAAAIDVASAYRGPIHLLLTDVVMPGLGGVALAERLHATRPETCVLYMSGYAEESAVQQGILFEGVQFIAKPLELHGLLRKVRSLLDRRDR